jgi:hypothetical protein
MVTRGGSEPIVVREVDDGTPISLEGCQVIIAGYTGRDQATLRRHIAELAEEGIPEPDSVPAFYPVDASSLVAAPATVAAPGPRTSGEAEPVLIRLASGERFLGVGSDHTDREHEKVSIAESKRRCAKPIGPEVWRWEAIADRWDDLLLRSHVGDERTPYQDATLAALRRPDEILELAAEAIADPQAPLVLYLGTVPLLDGFAFPTSFRAALRDPLLDRELSCEYRVDGAAQPQPTEEPCVRERTI